MKRILVFLLIMLVGLDVSGQTVYDYIAEGLSSNRQLNATTGNYQVALRTLDEAKKVKSLSVDFMPSYTLAAGGRTIDVPIGDLLNPVYSSLNTLTASDQFPQVENASELLNPNNFYDLKVRTSYPLINRSIGINESIKSIEVNVAEQEINLYRQRLTEDIASAYYDYQMAQQSVEIYSEAAILINENIRVNRGLNRIGKGLFIDVRAAQNDSVQMAKDILNAQLNVKKAAAYLNFLVNRPLEATVPLEKNDNDLPAIPEPSTGSERPEITQLNELTKINQQLEVLAKAQSGPQLNAFVDVGVQDFDFNIDGQSPYILGGLSLSLNLFDGGKTKSKIELAKTKVKQLQDQRLAVEQQITLEGFSARQDIDQIFNSYQATEKEVKLRRQLYTDQLKRYKTGVTNYIRVQDTRNDLIQAQLQLNLTRFEAWKKVAEYKRILAIND